MNALVTINSRIVGQPETMHSLAFDGGGWAAPSHFRDGARGNLGWARLLMAEESQRAELPPR
jgi:hypothetical protein